jgi:hypothetical protein
LGKRLSNNVIYRHFGYSGLSRHPMPRPNDLSRSLAVFDQDSTPIAVIEMSQSSWLLAGIIPGVERHPLKKLEPNESTLLQVLYRWRAGASKTGHTITRIAVAFEVDRDGFWFARWLRARGIENPCHSSVERRGVARATSSENRSA